MSEFTLKYTASEMLRTREFVETGEAGPSQREIVIELDTPELRQAAVMLHGLDTDSDNYHNYTFHSVPSVEDAQATLLAHAGEKQQEMQRKIDQKTEYIRHSTEQRCLISSYVKLCDNERRKCAAAGVDLSDYTAALAEYDALKAELAAEKAERKAKERAHREQIEAEEAATREKREQEKAHWIEEHGSEYLQRAFAAGYDCQRQYTMERAATDAPDFKTDFDNNANWNDRCCPSTAALDIAEATEKLNLGRVSVVWLTKPPRGEADEEEYYDLSYDFEPCEAVVIRDYLGKYDLVQVIE